MGQSPRKSALGSENKGVSGFYETFDSGDGVTVPDGEEGNFAHQDSDGGLNNYCMNSVDDDQGSVPEVPSKKR